MSSITIQESTVIEPVQPYDELVTLTLQTVAASSARIYRQTFDLWRAWCTSQASLGLGTQPLDLRPALVLAFIGEQDTTKATRQRQLSALRKLAQMLYVLSPDDHSRQFVEALRLVKAPVGTGGRQHERRALSPAEADKVLRVWTDNKPLQRRNRALIAVLALGALRRAEAAALRWRDVDFDNGVITVRHGKGDKAREVPLAGDLALQFLRDWQMWLPADRGYVFCAVGKGDKVGADKPITGTDVYRIVKQTEKLAGVAFAPHDLRRTFITEALATGTPLATVQAAAGHAQGATTLRYAQAVDARRARRELKLRYG